MHAASIHVQCTNAHTLIVKLTLTTLTTLTKPCIVRLSCGRGSPRTLTHPDHTPPESTAFEKAEIKVTARLGEGGLGRFEDRNDGIAPGVEDPESPF